MSDISAMSDGLFAYQYPGGDWTLDTTSPGRSAGLALDSDQLEILTSTWNRAAEPSEEHGTRPDDKVSEKVKSLVKQGLVYIGQCPRCAHSMRFEIAFGVSVVAASIRNRNDSRITLQRSHAEPFARWGEFWSRRLGRRPDSPAASDEHGSPNSAVVTFVCSCGEPHHGRPDNAPFQGCGAVWNQVANKDWDRLDDTGVRDDDAQPVTSRVRSVGTAEDAARAASATELASNPLARIRAQAGQWRTGTTTLTAALTVAAFLKGPTALSPVVTLRWASAAAAGVGFVLLLVGTYLSLVASLGMSGYDHRLLNAGTLRGYERARALTSINQLQWSVILVIAAIVLFAGAAFLALF